MRHAILKKTNVISAQIWKLMNSLMILLMSFLMNYVKKKTIFLLGDFSMNFLNYNIHSPTNEFLDSLSSHYPFPHILQSTKVNSNFKILLNNIFSNMVLPNIPSGNSTATLSDHLPQFVIARNVFLTPLIPV